MSLSFRELFCPYTECPSARSLAQASFASIPCSQLTSCVSLGGPGPMHSFSEWKKLLQTRYTTQSLVCAMMWQLASIHGSPMVCPYETFWHFVTDCPRLLTYRNDTFLDSPPQQDDWKLKQIMHCLQSVLEQREDKQSYIIKEPCQRQTPTETETHPSQVRMSYVMWEQREDKQSYIIKESCQRQTPTETETHPSQVRMSYVVWAGSQLSHNPTNTSKHSTLLPQTPTSQHINKNLVCSKRPNPNRKNTKQWQQLQGPTSLRHWLYRLRFILQLRRWQHIPYFTPPN